MRILAVIPTWNERDSVVPLLERLLAQPLDLSVLVVDDGSPDGTAAAVRELAERHAGRQVDLLDRTGKPRGLGRAYADGFAEALARSPDAVLQMDGDGQHPVETVAALVRALEDHPGAGLAIANRYAAAGSAAGLAKPSRRLLSRMGGWYARAMLRLPLSDATSGFRLWRREAIERIEPAALVSCGFVVQIETALLAARGGTRIVEVPYAFARRERGQSHMSWRIVAEAAARVLGWTLCRPRVKTQAPKKRGQA